jgi:enoyl-CoA hydratase/carnithine racemase
MSAIIYDKKAHVAHIRLNRPESLNAINRVLADELIRAWADFRDDKNCWVAIVSGEGETFCAGADIKEMKRGQWEFRESLLFGESPIGPSNYQVWKPIIGVLQGHVNGAGLWLALECDIRICAENAMFGTREAKVNIPALVAPFMADFMPRGISAEMMFTAKSIDAVRAYELGMVNKVIPQEELIADAEKMAEDICE